MRNKGLILVVFLLLVFIVAIVFTPTPTDWNFNYSKNSKEPHGSYMLFNELNQIFPNAEVIVSDTTIMGLLPEWDKSNTAYILISDNSSYFNRQYYSRTKDLSQSQAAIVGFLENDSLENNQIFMSSEYFNFFGGDTGFVNHSLAGVQIRSRSVRDQTMGSYYRSFEDNDSSVLTLKNTKRRDTTTLEYASNYILLDSLKHIKLGMINDTVSNFIKVPFNQNNLFLHSAPNAFTNYAMLNDGLSSYASETLSHMENIEYVIWDEYYKPFTRFMGAFNIERKSPLYIVNESRPLYIAKVLTILGCLLIIFTYFKRRQQAIPIVQPPSNKSVEFATNMGKLYHEKGNHHDIALKKIDYFEFSIRKKYKLKEFNSYKKKPEEFAKLTGFQQEDIEEYFKRKILVEQNTQLDESQLLKVSNAIENLKKNQL